MMQTSNFAAGNSDTKLASFPYKFQAEDFESSITQRFESIVLSYPQRIAILAEDQVLSYYSLNLLANRLAHSLLNIKTGYQQRTAILVNFGANSIAAFLGVIKAGQVCVSLDDSYPDAYLKNTLENAKTSVIITDSIHFERARKLAGKSGTILNMEKLDSALSSKNPNLHQSPDNLAVILYTSGSTGQAKGVVQNHRNLLRSTLGYINAYTVNENDRSVQLASCSGAQGLVTALTPLLRGAALCPYHIRQKGLHNLSDWLRKTEITLYISSASIFRHFVHTLNGDENFVHLRLIRLGGEIVYTKDIDNFRPVWPDECVIMIAYSSTESGNITLNCLQKDTVLPGKIVSVGYPVPGMEVLLYDEADQEVASGQTGEIIVRSRYLSPGYWRKNDLNIRIFPPELQQENVRIYRTGDLGRRREDGSLEYRDREDFRVKIRGYRIEPGEIESILGQYSGINEVVVTVREDQPGDKRLVAYLTHSRHEPPNLNAFRLFLKEKLPEYMVPSAFVLLDKLPLTPNGKIDRKALPAPDQTRSEFEQSYVPPRSPIEERLVAIWREVLNIDRIGIHDNFFESGGHSLLAMQLIVRINKVFKIDFPLNSLFEAPTVVEQSVQLENKLKLETSNTIISIKAFDRKLYQIESNEKEPMSSLQEQNNAHSLQESVDKTYTFPTSFAQQRLWFLDRLLGASGLYNIPWAIQLNGKLDVSALQQSLNAIVARHEVLRTCFIEQDGEPLQIIRASIPFACTLMALSAHPQEHQGSEIQSILHAEGNKPFDLKEAPLIRASLLKLSEQEHILLISIHHIVSDGWSMGVLRQELAGLYGAFSQGQSAALPELPIQYADYAICQREWLQGEVLERQLGYWKTQLADLTVLELPTDRPRPKQQSYRGARAAIKLSAELTRGLKTLSQQHNVTLFMTLLAALQVLLHRYSGQEDIVVGTAIAGRNRQEIENLIGFFVNTLALRTDLSGTPSFVQLLSRVREVCLSAYAHQDLPFEKLVAELQVQRDMSRHPLFQVMLVLHLQPAALQDMQLPGLTIGKLAVGNETAKFDLSLSLVEHPEGLTGSIEYSTDLFNAETITRLAGHFQTLLAAIALRPETAIAELPLLTAPERQQLLVEWNATKTDYPKHKCIHQLFEEQAARTPDAIALVFEDQQLSYQALNAQANQLAHYLTTVGVKADTLVAICMERSLDLVIGLLAILKAGGAYVPLDPAYPSERLAFMLDDSQISLLLTQKKFDSITNASILHKAIQHVYLDEALPTTYAVYSITTVTSENLAYVIYTSGSTGNPKGVQISHRSLLNFLMSMAQLLNIKAQDALLAVTTLSFDIAGLEMYLPLICGAKIVIASRELAVDGSALAKTLSQADAITIMQATPATWRLLLAADWKGNPQLKILCGGETLPHDLAIQLQQKSKEVWNLYGPTETTIWSTVFRLSNDIDSSEVIPIGHPMANTQLYILDKHLQLVPIGVTGELHIGGDGLARGYLNSPELTAEKFIKHPFSDDPQARLYKTGDLARYLPDGTIEFLGRIDHQIKLRGFRIELGEIESVLGQHPGINEVVVAVREDQPGDKRLVAYLTHSQHELPNINALRQFLKEKLPEYMVPAAFVLLDQFPLTPNGKIDRKALPEPDQTRSEFEQSYVQPRSPIEEMLVAIWREVLNIDQIGIHDNFFELGGHSLLAVQLVVRINQQFQIDFPLYSLFEAPTVAGLSVQLDTIRKQDIPNTITPIKALQRKPYQIK